MKKLALLLAITVPLLACELSTATTTPPLPTGEAAPTPAPTLTPTPAPPSDPLPHVVAAIDLGEPPQVCTGGAVAVDASTGYLHTTGTLSDPLPYDAEPRPCLTVIDPTADRILETRNLPFVPYHLAWDGGRLYAFGHDDEYHMAVADATTGELITRVNIAGHGQSGFLRRLAVRDRWAYAQSDTDLTPIPLWKATGAEWPISFLNVAAFDLAEDGRIATVSKGETPTVRVYEGPYHGLLAEREVGPGRPGETLAFAGRANRIFVLRRLPVEGSTESRYLLDVLDAATLETVDSYETEWLRGLTADPARGRVYAMASEGRVLSFDAATGQPQGTIFIPPPAEGLSVYDPYEKLHVDPATGRVYHVYSDFDGATWAASFDPDSGMGVADARVPGGAFWAPDGGRGRLYFAGKTALLALDTVALQPAWRMGLSRRPVSAAVAPEHGLLFVGDAGGDVHALDLQTHAEVQLLQGVGGYVDVDLAHGWLYAGDVLAGGVSAYDLDTMELRGTIPQPGRPTASPADGLVYILEEDVYSADGATLAVIVGRTARDAGCNGCGFPTGVVVDPNSGITLTTTYGTWVGKPPSTSHAAVDPLTGRAFVTDTSGGYRVIYTLAVYADLTLERELSRRAGLYGQPLYNPISGHLYLTAGSRLLIFDGETLDPAGWLWLGGEDLAPAAVDPHSGRLYLLAGPQVLVLEPTGGRFETPPPQPVDGLPGLVEGIVPLPDGTLFACAKSDENYYPRFYRSTDGGGTWEEIRGGLPLAPTDLAAGPASTLYAAVKLASWRGDLDEGSWGEGVYRSEDGGDTWTPFSRGLLHLRVGRIHAGADGEVHALASGMWPDQEGWRVPTIWRLGADDAWTQIEVPGAGPYLDIHGAVPTTYTRAVQAAWHEITGGGDLYRSWGSDLQRSADGGLTWETLGSGPDNYGLEVLTGPGDPPVLYWRVWGALYRSPDGGATWAQFSHPALESTGLTAIAVAEWNGEEMLFVGTEEGAVLVLPVTEAEWRRIP